MESRGEAPQALNDRAADNWRHLLAIADALGGGWPQIGREAAVGLSGAEEDGAIRVMLLGDIRVIFADLNQTRIASPTLAEALAKMEERPCPEWHHGKPITPKQIATLLSPFEVRPKMLRIGTGEAVRGYEISNFDDAFARYLSFSSATPQQTNVHAGFDDSGSATTQNLVADEKISKAAPGLECCGVADEKMRLLDCAHMNARQILRTVAEAGGRLTLDGGDLVLTAPAPLPASLVDAVKRHKTALVSTLSAKRTELSALVDRVASYHRFTETQREEARQIAMADGCFVG